MAEDAVLKILKSIQADLAKVKADTAALRTQGISHTHQLAGLHQDVRLIRAALNDFGELHVTHGEVTAIHEELTKVQQDLADLTARVEVIEER